MRNFELIYDKVFEPCPKCSSRLRIKLLRGGLTCAACGKATPNSKPVENAILSKEDYVGRYMDKKLKDCKLPYGLQYLNLRDKTEEMAEKRYPQYVRQQQAKQKPFSNLI